MVALAEVARGDDIKEHNGGEDQRGSVRAAWFSPGMGQKYEAEQGAGGLEQGDEEFGGQRGGDVEDIPEGDGDGGQPDDGRGVGVERLGAVECGSGEPAAGHEQEPELVVTGGGEQCQECGHPCGSGGQYGEEQGRSALVSLRG